MALPTKAGVLAPGAAGSVYVEPGLPPPEAKPVDTGPTDSRMQYDLALNLESGRGGAKDMAEAAKWYRRSAEQGFAPAQTSLAYLYERGQGVTRDYAEAVKWYTKAADQKKLARAGMDKLRDRK